MDFEHWILYSPFNICFFNFQKFSFAVAEIVRKHKQPPFRDVAKLSYVSCSARDWERSGLLGGIPRVVVQISALL